jgi:hypothetical protein
MDYANQLLDRIPLDAKKQLESFLLDLSEPEINEFVSKIGKYSSMREMRDDYNVEIQNKLSQEVFLLNAKGIGMGEIWCAWLIKDAVLSGGGEHYDVIVGSKKYEIKSYNFAKHYRTKEWQLAKYSGPWRLGNAGAMSNFKFVENLLYNANIAHLIQDSKIDHPDVKKMKSLVAKMEKGSKYQMIGDFARGEVNQKKMKWMIEFINTANLYVHRQTGKYNIVTFASTTPGYADVNYLVKDKDTDDLEESFEIIRKIDMEDHSDPVVFDRMLTKSKYVREGVKSMIDDINSDIERVEQKYEGVEFVVFRKDSVAITPNLKKINNRTKKGLLDAVGDVFNLSSASVRVKEL